MPSNNYLTKADSTKPYRVDNRVTFHVPLTPIHADICDGPTRAVVSGMRVNYPSGTDN